MAAIILPGHTLSPSQAAALREKLQPLAEEVATYQRELGRLLADGEAGRWAVIRGSEVLGTWDTYRDASQYAHERFANDECFMVQQIEARHAELLAELQHGSGDACPS